MAFNYLLINPYIAHIFSSNHVRERVSFALYEIKCLLYITDEHLQISWPFRSLVYKLGFKYQIINKKTLPFNIWLTETLFLRKWLQRVGLLTKLFVKYCK